MHFFYHSSSPDTHTYTQINQKKKKKIPSCHLSITEELFVVNVFLRPFRRLDA